MIINLIIIIAIFMTCVAIHLLYYMSNDVLQYNAYLNYCVFNIMLQSCYRSANTSMHCIFLCVLYYYLLCIAFMFICNKACVLQPPIYIAYVLVMLHCNCDVHIAVTFCLQAMYYIFRTEFYITCMYL